MQEDGFTDGVIEHSNGQWEDKSAAHVFYTSTPDSRAGEGLWATGTSMVDGLPFRVEPLEPLTDDQGILPPPGGFDFDLSNWPRIDSSHAKRMSVARTNSLPAP